MRFQVVISRKNCFEASRKRPPQSNWGYNTGQCFNHLFHFPLLLYHVYLNLLTLLSKGGARRAEVCRKCRHWRSCFFPRHCGPDPQSPEKKKILNQVQNDGRQNDLSIHKPPSGFAIHPLSPKGTYKNPAKKILAFWIVPGYVPSITCVEYRCET